MPAYVPKGRPKGAKKGKSEAAKKLKYKEVLAAANAAYVPTGNPRGNRPKTDDPEHLEALAIARERRAKGLPAYVKNRNIKKVTKAEKKRRYKEILATANANYVPSGNPRRPKTDDPQHLEALAIARKRRAKGLPDYMKKGKQGITAMRLANLAAARNKKEKE